ncbi:helix-turn-helix transcriptional regulator [Hamadaea tsunoensis]|uniref:helix-turn-helix transcriptional regulator n=1 Tax=Hamadaea tsunoensis TaxID=53368 RepID=UPI0004029CA4|nr:AraC family transcriptional regulator [Hamadaea tsunoensis]
MEEVTAWRPAVPGIAEVFHAQFVGHAYPMHVHEHWTVLIVDDGAIRYGLDRAERGATGGTVTLLPPHVPHDGRAATHTGFRKRVLYLDAATLGEHLVGAAVDAPTLPDPLLRHRLHQLHDLLSTRTREELEAETRLAFITERLSGHLKARPADPPDRPGRLADEFRALLDAYTRENLTLKDAALRLNARPAQLVRAFRREFGLPPHAYLTGRRVALARDLLLAGGRPADVALAAGFFDQAHLNRHFTRHVGTTPARYARLSR